MSIVPFGWRCWLSLFVTVGAGLTGFAADGGLPTEPGREQDAPEATLRVLVPNLIELELIQAKRPGQPGAQPWNLAMPAAAVVIPDPTRFLVKAGDRIIGVTAVGFKRRASEAPLRKDGELRVATWLYLKLAEDIPVNATVTVESPPGDPWGAGRVFRGQADPLRTSPVIHVNQEGYLPAHAKKAMVGHFLGSLGELQIPEAEFQVVGPDGRVVHKGRLKPRPDHGYTYLPAPYQKVYEADFTALRVPGEYRLVVPGLGASVSFRIDDGVAMAFARAYALGIYHQRCGTDNALPFTRFTHADCHVAPARVPSPQVEFPFTWRALASRAPEPGSKEGAGIGPPMSDEAAQLYPFVRKGEVNVAGGHHDAGDYSKYTTNSASFIHCLVFAVDAIPGAAEFDNLGLPESGDGISDLLQEAKWESDFLARMQDDDGGFYFLVYPRDRAYESDVLPAPGDPQVVWPKTTAATAAAVAALAQAGSSPRFRQAYPKAAADYLERARKGWRFLMAAIERHGPQGSYQRLTHYGDNHRHDDELAWAAAELFLATGEEEYHRKFKEWCDPADGRTRRWGWWRLNESWGHAIRSYAFAVRSGRILAGKVDASLEARCQREVEEAGRDALLSSGESAYGTSLPAQTKRMRGGGWHFSLDQGFDLVVASLLDYPRGNDPRPEFLEAYLANLNYEAGTNPVNVSYVTGMGRHAPRELVHQYAANDRRALPPSGLPVGNIQAGQPFLAPYKGELGALSFPEDGAATAPYPYYDRWTDTHNVTTEFVIVNQARALAGLVWLAAQTIAGRQPWRPVKGEVTGLPEEAATGEAVTVGLAVPQGMDLAQAVVTWEGGGQVGHGSSFTFKAGAHGRQWVEAEARWPDGRRVFAAGEFGADNGRAEVTISVPEPVASVDKGSRAVFEFHRTGDTAVPLTVRFTLLGTAAKWKDYRRPEGDMPVELVIPAGRESVAMAIRPMPEGLGADTRELLVVLKPHEDYNVGSPREARATLVGKR